jgi:hypothetical protein
LEASNSIQSLSVSTSTSTSVKQTQVFGLQAEAFCTHHECPVLLPPYFTFFRRLDFWSVLNNLDRSILLLQPRL